MLRIDRSYEIRGLLEKVTSKSAVTRGTTLNEVVREYDALGLLYQEYQEHEGAQDGSTLYVEYAYDDANDGGELTKGMRPESVKYPNGRQIYTTYGISESADDNLNRVYRLRDGSPTGLRVNQYTYLGLGTVVIEEMPELEGVQLDYYTGGDYDGFDRFGRVVEHLWTDGVNDVDKYVYDHDEAGNRKYRENTTTTAKDEYYTYDGVYRLKNFDRGDLNGGKTGIDTPVRDEDFGFDPTGNWTDYIQKTSGTEDLNQDRTHNKVNEMTNITETVGPVRNGRKDPPMVQPCASITGPR